MADLIKETPLGHAIKVLGAYQTIPLNGEGLPRGWVDVRFALPMWEDDTWYWTRHVLVWGPKWGHRIAYLDCMDKESIQWRLVDGDGWNFDVNGRDILCWQELPAAPAIVVAEKKG